MVLLLSVTRKDANNQQLSSISYGYDSQGRQNLSTDARTGTTTSFFNNADQVSGTVQSGQVTTNFFDTWAGSSGPCCPTTPASPTNTRLPACSPTLSAAALTPSPTPMTPRAG